MNKSIIWADVFQDTWCAGVFPIAVIFGGMLPLVAGLIYVGMTWGIDGVLVGLTSIGWLCALTLYLRGRHHRNLRVAEAVRKEMEKAR